MRMQLITPLPAFYANCLACEKLMDSEGEAIYADLDGPAFKAYYCALDVMRLTQSFEVGINKEDKQ